jgi:hypothetical protein
MAKQTSNPASEDKDKNVRPEPYPPSPGDQAGEKTTNVPPAKKAPAVVPESENPDPAEPVPTATEALANADAETARLRARVAELEKYCADKGVLPESDPAAKKKAGAVKVARVTPQGGSAMEVEYPADAKDAKHAAVEAYKAKAGIWSLPTEPAVEFPDKGK